MFRRVLIANRGEIACRIAATLRQMGARPIAVVSDADLGARHARLADHVCRVGPAEPGRSYLDIDAILRAAHASGAEAVHPGYGFLSENAAFAAAVETAGLAFIGPTAEQIQAMGDKRAARAVAERVGVPVVPGAEGRDVGALAAAAARIGYPVILKAALGGGGKGMRVVADETGLREGFESTQRLALSGFGDAAVYLEKHIGRARHIEVQVAGDGAGGVVHLFERECSLQRRHQKVIEESPGVGLDPALRDRLTSAAMAVARAVQYRGVGTVEFLLAPGGDIFFLEMNTRLQVEHPVTEAVTGVDVVRLQVEIAATGRLPLAATDLRERGHAIEARIYAEDPATGFLPQAGRTSLVTWPDIPFVRVDAGVESGDDVPVHYDPILAKIIAWGPDRARARERLVQALDETVIHGVITNLPFLRALLRAPAVVAGRFDTEWIEREFLADFAALATAPVPDLALAAVAIADAFGPAVPVAGTVVPGPGDPFLTAGPWRLPGLA